MTTNWICKKFGELTAEELYTILRLRSEVFVVEQNCVFLDLDNKDQYCDHLAGWQGDNWWDMRVLCRREFPIVNLR